MVEEKLTKLSKRQLIIIVSIFFITPIGFYSKFYKGPAAHWINDSLGGMFYVVFWCLVFYFLFPKSKTYIIALSVLTATCILECLQLWHPPFLEFIRQNFIGRTILGSSFVWTDFPYYFIGCFVGWAWMNLIRNRTEE